MSKIKKTTIINFLDWLIHMIAYAAVFVLASFLFDTFYIDTNYFCVFPLLASVVIYVLNKTIKPILVTLTMPITGLTLGLFYFVINVFILKLADWILLSHFVLGNTIYAFFIAIFISVMNLIIEGLIIKPIIRRFRNNEQNCT